VEIQGEDEELIVLDTRVIIPPTSNLRSWSANSIFRTEFRDGGSGFYSYIKGSTASIIIHHKSIIDLAAEDIQHHPVTSPNSAHITCSSEKPGVATTLRLMKFLT
jgi:hypothetical protein